MAVIPYRLVEVLRYLIASTSESQRKIIFCAVIHRECLIIVECESRRYGVSHLRGIYPACEPVACCAIHVFCESSVIRLRGMRSFAPNAECG